LLAAEDFFLRRCGLNWWAAGVLADAVPVVAKIFAAHFGWSPEPQQAVVESSRRAVPHFVP